MTAAISFLPGVTTVIARLTDGLGPASDWLGHGRPGALVQRLFDGDEAPVGPTRVVCPFCGETYPAPRNRCSSCSGLPVVAPDDTQVYETVLAPCGPSCGRAGSGRASARASPSNDLLRVE